MTILVTGASGFVGSFLAKRTAIVPFALEGRSVDLTEPSEVAQGLDAIHPDVVVHLAAQSWVPAALADPMGTYRVNVLGTLNLLEALAKRRFAGRLLYVSSGDVYGRVPEQELPVTEAMMPKPGNPYAASKVAAEALCRQWATLSGLDIVIARPFNHIGPRQDTRFAVADFAKQAVRASLGRGSADLQVGDIDASRDFTDVRDIIEAYLAIIERGQSGETYNICSGREHSLRDIIGMIGRELEIALTCSVDTRRVRPSEQRRMRGSHKKLNAHTGWVPQIDLAHSLRDIIDYWKEEEQK